MWHCHTWCDQCDNATFNSNQESALKDYILTCYVIVCETIRGRNYRLKNVDSKKKRERLKWLVTGMKMHLAGRYLSMLNFFFVHTTWLLLDYWGMLMISS